jgi:hypothetical protein
MSVCLPATMKGSLTLAKQSKNDQTLAWAIVETIVQRS